MKFLSKRFYLGLFLMLVCILLSACGPSLEERVATAIAETAAAATSTPIPTSTPEPTPTATPVPYDLSVLVVPEDSPISGASVILVDLDDEDGTQITDDVGQVFWYDLSGEALNIIVSAQGYFSQDIIKTIDRGINNLTAKLKRDPHGVLPLEACGPGEKLLYLEDFQDDEVQGWPEIDKHVQGWDLVRDPDSAGNLVAQFSSNMSDTQIAYQDGTFEDAVWRTQFMTKGKPGEIRFYWHLNTEPAEMESYTVVFADYGVIIGIQDLFRNLGREWLLKEDVWQNVEISTYDGTLEVWLDGIQVLEFTDARPLPGGTIGLEIWASEIEGPTVYFDNLTVCELSAPFVPKPKSEP